MQVIENVLKPSDHKLLLMQLSGEYIPWNFCYNVAYGVGDPHPGFSTPIYRDGEIENQTLWYLTKDIIKVLKPRALWRVRVGLIQHNGSQDTVHNPHIDFPGPHFTSCYYVNDSTGPTTIYNETYEEYNEPKNFTVKDTYDPKANSLIIFDGQHYHSSSSPTKPGIRLVITFNYR